MKEDLEEALQQDEQYPDNNRAQMEKAKKQLTYLLIFSVIMLFGGLSSAYIVSMGDSFWLKVPLPMAFWVSTALIILSSVCVQLGLSAVKKGNTGALKGMMVATLLLGLGFVYFQFKGYGQLIDNGIHPVNNHIIVTDGKYGDYFEIKKGDDYIEVNGNDYLINGKKLSAEEMKSLQAFAEQFVSYDLQKPFEVKNYGKPYTLLFENKEMKVSGTSLQTKEGERLPLLDRERLHDMALNVRDGRGDFFVHGEMGKDFKVYYKGEELSYKDRQLQRGGRKLTPYLQLKSMESADTASSYLYIISILHLVHVLITILFLVAAVIRSFTGRINKGNTIELKTTSIFWHFLGALWLYLLLFLLFIH